MLSNCYDSSTVPEIPLHIWYLILNFTQSAEHLFRYSSPNHRSGTLCPLNLLSFISSKPILWRSQFQLLKPVGDVFWPFRSQSNSFCMWPLKRFFSIVLVQSSRSNLSNSYCFLNVFTLLAKILLLPQYLSSIK